MKVKISFNKNDLANFFLEHIEKVIFGLFILVFATIIYGAVWNREKFDKTPQSLNNETDKAQRELERPFNPEDPEFKKLVAPDYHKIAEKIEDFSAKKSINEGPYRCDCIWDRPVFEQKELRGQPKFFAVKDLRVSAEIGAFRSNPTADNRPSAAAEGARPPSRTGPGTRPTAGSNEITGKCWVVITGLVPLEEQANAYKEAFRDSILYDLHRDSPVYEEYWVDRAEITSPADVENPKWSKTFQSENAENTPREDWGQVLPDVVQSKYVDPILTYPLGPLVNREWGREVAHEPEIPLSSSATKLIDEGDLRRDVVAGGRPGDTMRTPTRSTMARNAEAMTYSADKAPEYKLFRFFDFSVEPGKRYIYRVRLALKNPNYGLRPSLLKDATWAQNKVVKTEDSLPSGIVYVPKDTQTLVVSVVKSRASGDYSGKVLLKKWLIETGQEVYKEFPSDRGQVLNFAEQKPSLVGVKSGHTAMQDAENVDFISDATVLDMGGGRRLIGKDRNLIEPGAMLLMIMNGNEPVLLIHDELEDQSEVTRVTSQPESSRDLERTPPPGRPTGREARDGERLLLEEENPLRRPPTRPGRP